MDSKKYGRWGTGEGGCRIDLLVIQLYHWYDTSTVACSHLERALRSATGTTPGATRAAVLRADGSLHSGRGGARPPHRPARAAPCRRALGVPLVRRARPASVAPGVSPGRRARGAATLRREPALLRARARRAGVHGSRVPLHRPGGWDARRRARGAAEPFLRAGGRRTHPGRGRRALLQSRDRCPRRRRAPRDAGRAGRPASCGLRYAEPLVTGRKRPVLESPGGRWLLLIHQLPPKPDYFRVKIWRRLQRIGAVAIKNSVYVLPHTEQATEDFQWLRRDILAGGGEASVCQAAFVDGLSDGQIEALFRAQRDAEYAELARAAGDVAREDGAERESSGEVARLERRLAEIVALDHFGAPGRRAAEAALSRARDRPKAGGRLRTAAARPTRPVRGRTWVTRSGVHVDRIASAWLIRRFIDPKARFRFVTAQDARTSPGELRFDMFEAEYTHEGDRCTFETLVARFGLGDAGVAVIGELVHDIDCKDGKFARTETAGLERMIAGVVRRYAGDDARLERGAAVLDDLYEAFRGLASGR